MRTELKVYCPLCLAQMVYEGDAAFRCPTHGPLVDIPGDWMTEREMEAARKAREGKNEADAD
jgi:hypothetical protein